MKLQGLGIVFAIIILPVIIILSYYIQLSVDTVALQTSYKSKLNDSTYDSMLAFEMNTANENLSTVADSLRSIIEASNSVFFDSLASNFGMSNANKSLFQAYTPAILYTLYDGYYIYTPTKQPELLTYQDWMLTTLFNSGDPDGRTLVYSPSSSVGELTTSTQLKPEDIIISKADVSSKGGQPIYTHDGRFVYKVKSGKENTEDYKIGNSYYTAILSDESVGKISYKLEYMLKSYMPYTARYVHEDNTTGNTTHDITINYTLDNYMNIVGNINGIYYAKTGYLIPSDVVNVDNLDIKNPDGTDAVDALGKTIDKYYLMALNEDEAEELCLSGKYKISLTINCRSKKDDGTADQVTIVSNPQALDRSSVFNSSGAREDEIQSQLSADYANWHDNSYPLIPTGSNLLSRIQTEESELANMRAIAYYVRNQIFSNWVYDNLGSIQAKDIQNDIISNTVSEYASSIGNNYSTKTASFDTLFQNFKGDNSLIFGDSTQDTDLESNFTNHKDGVIRNSIQYNLNLAFSSYTEMYGGNLSFQMPVISDSEWERIITNVSIVSFLQGIPCGTKNFSSYSIVNSTNNELTVIPSEIYYIPTNRFNDEGDPTNGTIYAHRVDCELFPDGYSSGPYGVNCSPYVSMKSNDVKYDGIYNKNKGIYEYNFRNLLDYSCIINKNLREKNYTIGGTEAEVQRLDPSKWVGDDALNSNRRIAYYTGIAEQRQRLYKTNALTTSSGYTYQKFADEYFSSNTNTPVEHVKLADGKTLKDVSEIEIYLKSFQVSVGNSIVIKISATSPTQNQQLELYGKDEGGNDIWVGQRGYSNLAEANGTNLTIRARCHTTDSSTLNEFNLLIEDVEANSFVYGKCIGVKITYK